MMRIICGAEEPLCPSGWFSVLDESTGESTRSEFIVKDLNRYSFVFHGDEHFECYASEILGLVALQYSNQVFFVSGWKWWDDGYEKVRCRWLKSRRKSRGWKVFDHPNICMAVRSLVLPGAIELAPHDDDPRMSPVYLVFGNILSVQEEFGMPDTVFVNLVHQSFMPSFPFLSWLKDHCLGLAYHRKDDLGRDALVVITSHYILPSMRTIEDFGPLFFNEAAGNAYIWTPDDD